MFQRLLVCLDGSSLAEQILPYAEEQARRFDAKIELFQAVHVPGPSLGLEVPVPIPDVKEALRREGERARSYLHGVADQLRGKGLEAETLVLEGLPGKTIVDYANERKIDLIALATHGRGGLGRLVFGSVADYVLRHAGMPILLIRPR